MKTFLMFRIYKAQAEDRKQFIQLMKEAEAAGDLDQYFERQSYKEEEPQDWKSQLKKQVTGK